MSGPVDTDRIRRDIEDGNLILAYDSLRARLASGETDDKTRYLYVLTLARMGLTDRALAAYDTHGLARIGSTEAQSIYSRLLKDRALGQTGADRVTALTEAADSYHAVYQKTDALFPAINAASLYALAGNTERATALARSIAAAELPDPAQYYDYATLAEAHAILGHLPEVNAALTKAVTQPGAGTGARAVTARQIGLLLEHHGLRVEARRQSLSALSGGRSVWFASDVSLAGGDNGAGLRSDMRRFLTSEPVAAAFGSLTNEAEVIAAEEMILADVPLFVFLAAPVGEAAGDLTDDAGRALSERIRKCLEASTERHVVNDAFHGDHPLGQALTRRLAWGKAVAYGARNLCRPHKLYIHPAGAMPDRFGPEDGDVTPIEIPGHGISPVAEPPSKPQDAPPARREVSMLFADFAGFSALPDGMLPQLIERASGALAVELENLGDTHLFSNTWGDAFFSVFSDTTHAVRVAQTLLARLQADDLRDLIRGLRISLHHGLAMEIFDPVLGASNYFGREVSRAARIEPVTPPGCIYASEAFVLADASAGHMSARFEYVGQVELPKNFGTERLYLLC